MSEVSGNLLYLFKKGIIERKGKEFYDQLVEKTDEDVQKILKHPLLSDVYYPLKVYQQGLDILMEMTSKEEVIAEAEYKAEYQMDRFFGLVKMLATIDFVLKRINKMWKKDFSAGHVEILNSEKGRYVLKINDYVWGKAQIVGFEAYMRRMSELILKKECTSKLKKIDDKTIELSILSKE